MSIPYPASPGSPPLGLHEITFDDLPIGDMQAALNGDAERIPIMPDTHPVGSRMLVDRVSLMGSDAPAHDITIKEWNEDNSELLAQVNVPGGTLAWHKPEEYYFWWFLDENGEKVGIPINDQDHRVGTRMIIVRSLDQTKEEVIIIRWGSMVMPGMNGASQRRRDKEVRLYSITANTDAWAPLDSFKVLEILEPIHPQADQHPAGTDLLIRNPYSETGEYINVTVDAWDNGAVRFRVINSNTLLAGKFPPSAIAVLKVLKALRKPAANPETQPDSKPVTKPTRGGPPVAKTQENKYEEFFQRARQLKKDANELGFDLHITMT